MYLQSASIKFFKYNEESQGSVLHLPMTCPCQNVLVVITTRTISSQLQSIEDSLYFGEKKAALQLLSLDKILTKILSERRHINCAIQSLQMDSKFFHPIFSWWFFSVHPLDVPLYLLLAATIWGLQTLSMLFLKVLILSFSIRLWYTCN